MINKTAKLAQLPATQFQNGYSHCINKVHKVHGLKPYETHFVWVDGNNNGEVIHASPVPPWSPRFLKSLSQPSSFLCATLPSGKMHRMREHMYFLDPPLYYAQPGMGDRVVVAAGGSQGGSNGGEKGASFKSSRCKI